VQNREIVLRRFGRDFVEADAMRRSINQLAVRHHGGELCKPGRIPIRTNLAARLVACARAAVEAVIRRRLQE